MAQDRIDLANTADAHEEKKMDMKSKLSTLWIFVSLNYLYCDVSSLMDPELLPQYLRGNVHGLQFSPMTAPIPLLAMFTTICSTPSTGGC